MNTRGRRRLLVGAASGIGSAILFGLSAPFAKLLLPAMSPWVLAGVLYLGAGIGLSLARLLMQDLGSNGPDRLRREDLPRLVVIILAGGVAGPVLLLVGLARVPGIVGSLLLNLEAVFTRTLAVVAYRERLARIELLGAGLKGCGPFCVPPAVF